jgi:hypothetical protein
METLTEVLSEAVLTVVGILIAAAVSYFVPKLKHALKKLSEKDDLGIIENVVDMAVELAEKELTGKAGEEKFNHAAQYVALMANRYGIDISDEFIRGAVQKGWRRMDEKQKK